MIDSHLLYHTQCPECAKYGNDKSKNNLAVYSDGHQFCYCCKYLVVGDKIISYKNQLNQVVPQESTSKLGLPLDSTYQLPAIAKVWLSKYGFDHNICINNHIMWSDYQQKLIFPYYINGNLVGWQGRTFNPEEQKKRKWFSQGKLDSFIYTRGRQQDKLILVESIVSAIKLGIKHYSSPLYGSVISTHRWKGLAQLTDHIVVWLDPDKHVEAVKQANTGRLFIPQVSIILSDKKPKDYNLDELDSYL